MKFIQVKDLDNIVKGSFESKMAEIDHVLSENKNYKDSKRLATFGNYVVVVKEDNEFRRLRIENNEIVLDEAYSVSLMSEEEVESKKKTEAEEMVAAMLSGESIDPDKLWKTAEDK